MEPALGEPFSDDGSADIRRKAETLFNDFARGSETVLVRDLPDMFVKFEKIEGHPFFQPKDQLHFMEFAADNGHIPVHSEDLVRMVINHEAARSPPLEQAVDPGSSSDDDAAPGTIFKGRAAGSPSFSKPLPPRRRGRVSSTSERAPKSPGSVAGQVFTSSPLSRSRTASTSPPADRGAKIELLGSKERVSQLEGDLAEQAQNLETLQERIRVEEQRMCDLEAQLSERASRIESLTEQLTEKEQKLEKYQGLEDAYEKQMFELQEHSDELSMQLKNSAKENKELRVKSQSRQTYIERLEIEMSQLQKKREEDESAYRKLRNDHDGLKKEHNRLQKEREAQCDITERIRQQLLKETERVERKQEEVDRLAFQLQERDAEMARAERRIADLERQLEPLEDALAESKSANADLQAMIEQLRGERDLDSDGVNARHRRLSSEMDHLAGETSQDDAPLKATPAQGGAAVAESISPSRPVSNGLAPAEVVASNTDSPATPLQSSNGATAASSPTGIEFPSTPTMSHPTKPAGAESPIDDAATSAAGDISAPSAPPSQGEGLVPNEAAVNGKVAGERVEDELQTTPRVQPATQALDSILELDLDPAAAAHNVSLVPTSTSNSVLESSVSRSEVNPFKIAGLRWKRPLISTMLFSLKMLAIIVLFLAVSERHLFPGSGGVSRSEVWAIHTANTMSMPYSFYPDFGEHGYYHARSRLWAWVFQRGVQSIDHSYVPT